MAVQGVDSTPHAPAVVSMALGISARPTDLPTALPSALKIGHWIWEDHKVSE